MIKLDYLTLLSSEPVRVVNIGSVKPIKLKDVRLLGYDNYNIYVSILNLDKDQFLKFFKIQDKNISQKDYFDIIFDEQSLREMYLHIFSFFMVEKIEVDLKKRRYLVYYDDFTKKKKIIIGLINKDSFDVLRNIILQLNYCLNNKAEIEKPAGKHTAELLKKQKKYHELNIKINKKDDLNFSLPNIISKLCTYSNNVNLINIWDYTVFQVFDQFFALNNRRSIDMANQSYSIWGGDYKIPQWFENSFNNKN